MKRVTIFLMLGIFIFLAGVVSAQQATVCCEQTNTGAFCQNVPSSECSPDSRQAPTSCEATSYCKSGTCYDSNEGTCMDKTPQLVCNSNNGIWREESPPQCNLGCCVLGDQAAFVTLVRCKKLSGFLGLKTDFRNNIRDEVSCVLIAQSQDKGACVYEFEFENTCKFTTRGECTSVGEGVGAGTFYKDRLCSAEELGTNCGPTTQTTLIPGKDEVYFIDTCGNPANIYDSSKLNDKDYWTNIKTKIESCNPGGSNALSQTCGNCNYLLGSFGREKSIVGKNPTYGDYICGDLNCANGRKHGESWCVFDDGEKTDGKATAGSKFFKQICINSEVVVEACSDFRAEECIQDSIGSFSQAACRVNRWQDCLAQTEQLDCENSDRRDCYWNSGAELGNRSFGGVCLPKIPPGYDFWNSGTATQMCAQGNVNCVVKFEKGIFGGEKCVENCECLEEEWQNKYIGVCNSLGDCGPKSNWIGKQGHKESFKKTLNKLKRQK